MKRVNKLRRVLMGSTVLGLVLGVAFGIDQIVAQDQGSGQLQLAHKKPHTPQHLEAFQEVFMEQVRLGDLLFHGDAATQEQMGVNLSNIYEQEAKLEARLRIRW